MTDNEGNIHHFPVDEATRQPRLILNDRFPDLEVDPIELLSNVEGNVFESICEILQDADMHTKTLERLMHRNDLGFQKIIPATETSTSPRLITEHRTGRPVAVIPASFLANLAQQLMAADDRLKPEDAIIRSGRTSMAYAYGLLAFEELSPWHIIDAPKADQVSVRIATSLLCTGLEDGSQHDLPPNLIPHYMHDSLPKRLAATLTYLDMEKTLRKDGTPDSDASFVVDAFIERRIQAVHQAKHTGSLAVSDLDMAFAYPLAAEELLSFIEHASRLRERGIIRLAVPETDSK